MGYLEDIILKSFMSSTPALMPELWVAYFDSEWKQIGPRDSAKETSVSLQNEITLPPSSIHRVEVCRIGVYDAEEGGNVLCGWWDIRFNVQQGKSVSNLPGPIA
jgi:hypothetical protein